MTLRPVLSPSHCFQITAAGTVEALAWALSTRLSQVRERIQRRLELQEVAHSIDSGDKPRHFGCPGRLQVKGPGASARRAMRRAESRMRAPVPLPTLMAGSGLSYLAALYKRLHDLINPREVDEPFATVNRQVVVCNRILQPYGNKAAEIAWTIHIRQTRNERLQTEFAAEGCGASAPLPCG